MLTHNSLVSAVGTLRISVALKTESALKKSRQCGYEQAEKQTKTK
jgi:hypothetical protein